MFIDLPLLPLRPYQAKVWDEMFERDIKRAFLLFHRRAGKDVFCLQYMIAKAVQTVGNYWYLLPQQNQVRRAIWEGVTSGGLKYLDMVPKALIHKITQNEMKVVLRHPQNPDKPGSIISFLGGDRYDNLVGAGIKGCVISEYALQRPGLYDLVLEPMLRESKGWCVFNTTPRGENHAKAMYDFLAREKNAFVCKLTIDDTGGIVTTQDLEEERRRGKPEELIAQEYYCSFEGAIYGAYYASELMKLEADHLGDFPHDGGYPVHTLWDLGVSDSMAIWFVQFIEGAIRIIDYYENHTFGLSHYADVVLQKPYRYGGHHLPHDGVQRQLTLDEKALSIQNQLIRAGLSCVDIIPRTMDIYSDIQAVRALLDRCFFHKEKTYDGYLALKQYRREYDENRKCFKQTPLHDWTSHGADAFRILPVLDRRVRTCRPSQAYLPPIGF